MRNIPTDIFKLTTVKRPVKQGSIMVSEPFLNEQYFNHSVIALIDYNVMHGSMGVVLNNPTVYRLDEVIAGVDSRRRIPVYCGGPVSLDRLYFVHTLGDSIIPESSEFSEGLYVGGDFEAMIDYVNTGYRTEGVVRFFLGYSGWTPGQLETEVENSVWAVAERVPPAHELLSLECDKMWHGVVRTMGEPYKPWLLHPADIRAN